MYVHIQIMDVNNDTSSIVGNYSIITKVATYTITSKQNRHHSSYKADGPTILHAALHGH